ncbi:MAG: membrane protein insertion efficiency factor YidD [Verrucomicrobia bacterium]|nr:membrane protein insertion efficiency factor YidD [Verrucomicrobiota bacterium]
MNPAQAVLVLLLRGYRLAVSPLLATLAASPGMGCRFTPTCSQYAIEAIQRQGAARGAWLALRRLLRCHPWGGFGPDPVPGVRGAPPPPADGGAAAAISASKDCEHGS